MVEAENHGTASTMKSRYAKEKTTAGSAALVGATRAANQLRVGRMATAAVIEANTASASQNARATKPGACSGTTTRVTTEAMSCSASKADRLPSGACRGRSQTPNANQLCMRIAASGAADTAPYAPAWRSRWRIDARGRANSMSAPAKITATPA